MAELHATKRKFPETDQNVKKMKVIYDPNKSPLVILNERFHELKYEFMQEGKTPI